MLELLPVAPPLLAWYYQNRRTLPFRDDPTPYHIWVSEIMLQQTRVAAALPYYTRFMEQLPDIASLARCEEERLHKLWEGLGYYSRARNLQKAATIVVEQYGGELPGDYQALLALPGIGEYTAGAIASIAFGLPEVAVDGNVLRVFARLLASREDVMLPATKKIIGAIVKQHQPPDKAGDYNQAIMELGALVCLPSSPKCGVCPLQEVCHAKQQEIAAELPVKTPPKAKEKVDVCIFLVKSSAGKILLQKRPKKGLLAGLWQPFLVKGKLDKQQAAEIMRQALPGATIEKVLPKASHVFSHKIWSMYGWEWYVDDEVLPNAPGEYIFATKQEIADVYTLPEAFKVYKKMVQE